MISARRLAEVLGVVDYCKRKDLRDAIRNGERVVLYGKSTEGKALIQKMEEYHIPYTTMDNVYFFEEGAK